MTKMIFRSATPTDTLRHRSGQVVDVVPLDPDDYDADEVGPMFTATFPDGSQSDVFADELHEIGA